MSPTCFISYSWDNLNHKKWVKSLASLLRKNGVDIKLDQWDIHLGMDITLYMETSIRESDFVLLICTPQFAIKANVHSGGVGYEKSIVTGEIFTNMVSKRKFIPLLRSGTPSDSLPSYLKSRVFVDFRDEKSFEKSLTILLQHFFEKQVNNKPPLGKPPKFNKTIIDTSLQEISEKKRSKSKLELFKETYIFASDSSIGLGLANSSAKEWAENWIISHYNKDLNIYKEAYKFAKDSSIGLGLTGSSAKEWAKNWIISHYNKDLNIYKEAYKFANDSSIGLGLTSSEAMKWAMNWIISHYNKGLNIYKGAYKFANDSSIGLGLTSSEAMKWAQNWIISHYNKDLNIYKEAYKFANDSSIGLGLTSSEAMKWAKNKIS